MRFVSEAGTERARTVISRGTTELQEAVDQGHATVRAAADIALLPLETQKTILAQLPRDGNGRLSKDTKAAIRQIAKQIRSEDQKENRERRLDKMGRISKGNRPLPQDGQFGVIRADVATKFNTFSEETGSEKAPTYPVMTLEQLIDIGSQVNAMAAKNAVLILDATVPQLANSFYIAEAWGFYSFRLRGPDGALLRDQHGKLPAAPSGAGRYVSHQVWHKLYRGDQHATGYVFWNVHELVLMFARGDVPKPVEGTQERSLFEAPVGEHSEKPEYINEWIERYFDGVPNIELLRRGPARPGWCAWGNEVEPIPPHNPETGEIIEAVTVAAVLETYIVEHVRSKFTQADQIEGLLRKFIIPTRG